MYLPRGTRTYWCTAPWPPPRPHEYGPGMDHRGQVGQCGLQLPAAFRAQVTWQGGGAAGLQAGRPAGRWRANPESTQELNEIPFLVDHPETHRPHWKEPRSLKRRSISFLPLKRCALPRGLLPGLTSRLGPLQAFSPKTLADSLPLPTAPRSLHAPPPCCWPCPGSWQHPALPLN